MYQHGLYVASHSRQLKEIATELVQTVQSGYDANVMGKADGVGGRDESR